MGLQCGVNLMGGFFLVSRGGGRVSNPGLAHMRCCITFQPATAFHCINPYDGRLADYASICEGLEPTVGLHKNCFHHYTVPSLLAVLTLS